MIDDCWDEEEDAEVEDVNALLGDDDDDDGDGDGGDDIKLFGWPCH